MSDDKVKRWWIDLRPHSNARAQGYSTRHSAWSRPIVRFGVNTVCVMPVEDHERIVAELKAEIETLGKVYRSKCPECGYSGCVRGRKACDAEIDRQKETIATQKRVIEVLKACIQKEDHRCGIWHEGRKAIEQAESIERGEA